MTGYGIHELKYMKGQENLSKDFHSNVSKRRAFVLYGYTCQLIGRLSVLIYSY